MLKYRKSYRNVEAVMKRIFIKIISTMLCAVMLFTLTSCAVLDKIAGNIEDKPTNETTNTPNNDNAPTLKYKRSDLKYSFLSVVEGFDEGTPAQLSYSVFDTANGTLNTLQIPTNTFISCGKKTLGALFKESYNTAKSDGRGAAVNYACETLMDMLEADMLLPCDYYIYFDKTSLSDLVNEIDGVNLRIPFDMRFPDTTLIRSGDTKLMGEDFWRVMSYGSYAMGSELNAAKLLWTNVFYKLKESVSSDVLSLFMMDIRKNLYTSIPKTNGVDIFFLRKLLSLDNELYKFASADVQSIVEGGTELSVICKNTFLEKVNTFLTIYETDIKSEDFDTQLRFSDSASMTVNDAYNSTIAPTVIYTAHAVKNESIYIFAK